MSPFNSFEKRSLSRDGQRQMLMAIVGLLFLFLLNACGNTKSHQTNIDDRKAPFIVTGERTYDEVENIGIEENFEKVEVANEASDAKKPAVLKNTRATGKYGAGFTSNNTLSISTEVLVENNDSVVDDKDYIQAQFEGTFDVETGFATLTDKKVPFMKIIARCDNDCNSVVLYPYESKLNENNELVFTHLESSQQQLNDSKKIKELLESIKIQKNNENTSTAEVEKEESKKQNEDEIEEHVVEGDISSIGSFPEPYIPRELKRKLLEGMITKEEFKIQKTSVNMESRSNAPVSTTPAAVQPPKPAPVKIEPTLEIDEVALYPANLGAEYSGQSEKCYAKFKSVDGKNSKRCTQGGTLAFSTSFPEAGTGFERITSASKSHSSGLTRKILEDVAKEFSAVSTNLIGVNDIAKANGGPLGGHSSHQNGLDVDVRLPMTTRLSAAGNSMKRISANTDYEDLWKILKIAFKLNARANVPLKDTTFISRVFIDAGHIAQLCKSKFVQEDSKDVLDIFNYLEHWPAHTTHIHFRFKATYHNLSAYKIRFNQVKRIKECASLGVYRDTSGDLLDVIQ